VRIRVERSGGFAGLVRTAEVDTATLPEAHAREIEDRVRGIDFEGGARLSGEAEARPDAFQYDVSIDDGDTQHRVTLREPALPAGFREVFRRLLELS